MDKAIQRFGYSALERIAEAPAFNKWMYETISPYLKGNILEIGSGIGNISAFIIEEGKKISLSDYDSSYVQLLTQKFGTSSSVSQIVELDLATPDFKNIYSHLFEGFDSIFLLNVLEHIKDEALAIQNISFLLKPGGNVIILVPSYSFLFSKMDNLLGHYRRYTIKSLKTALKKNNFIIEKAFHFNLLGIAGWLWNKTFNKAEISAEKMNLFNRLVPIAKLIDKLTLNRIGLSTIAVASKPQTT